MLKILKIIKNTFLSFVILIVVLCVAVIAINTYITTSVKNQILSVDDASSLQDVDCILVLGCSVHGNTPSLMLRDRLERSIELYNTDINTKLLMSGDHGRDDYNEVGTMKQYAVDAGVPSSNIFMDHAGFSTYESLYRAKEIFQADKIVIVTQEYHLYRALFIARQFGIEAYGVASEGENYYGQEMREIREVLARVKDFATTIVKPEPKYLGEKIALTGDGNMTNDQFQ